MCPRCKVSEKIVKFGTYRRHSDGKICQRYRCKHCNKTFSETHFSIEFRLRKRLSNQMIFRALCSGVSQRRCAFLFGMHRDSIARRLVRFGQCAKHNLEEYRRQRLPLEKIQIDELETFEHTKCKPLTVPIAVEEKTRKILALAVARIPAKGPLAALARKKYGFRACERKKALTKVFEELTENCAQAGHIKSDESHAYPPFIRKYLIDWKHTPFKGRRGCVVGQGELKSGAWDPLFSLNHTYAMIRDGLKRLPGETGETRKKRKKPELSL